MKEDTKLKEPLDVGPRKESWFHAAYNNNLWGFGDQKLLLLRLGGEKILQVSEICEFGLVRKVSSLCIVNAEDT